VKNLDRVSQLRVDVKIEVDKRSQRCLNSALNL